MWFYNKSTYKNHSAIPITTNIISDFCNNFLSHYTLILLYYVHLHINAVLKPGFFGIISTNWLITATIHDMY